MCVYMCIYAYVYTQVDIYIYIYINICTHIHMCIYYTYILTPSGRRSGRGRRSAGSAPVFWLLV